MAGPWEKYATPAAEEGPWAKYKAPVVEPTPVQAPQEPSFGERLMNSPIPFFGAQVTPRDAIDTTAGAIRGAGSIGATIMWPIDKITDLVKGDRGPSDLTRNQERRASMTNALGDLGADTESTAFKVGKISGEIAGTAGAGGALANGLARIPGAATAVPGVISAIRTGGMTTGQTVAPGAVNALTDLGTRVVGGAITGGSSAGMVDPEQAKTGAIVGGVLPVAVKTAGYAGQKIANGASSVIKNALGLSTGVGSEPISQAFKAGQTGNKEFLANMKGEVPLTDVLDRAKQGIAAMTAAKSAEYRSGMIPIAGDKSVLNLNGIDKALQDASSVTSFKGQVKNQAAADAVKKMQSVVDDWKALDPAQFHTPEGLDALKQKLGGIMEEIPFEQRTARLAAGKVYDAAKSTIEAQAPTYAKVMKDYSEASSQISEIERALSLGDKASKDTAMRKLQSLMRNNVQTNYGNRLSLANTLEQKGGVDLLPSLSGQAMNSMTPRSLAGQAGSGATALAAMATSNPMLLAGLPLQSPRIVGSLAYGAGRFASGANRALGGGVQGAVGSNALSGLLTNEQLQQLGYQSAPVFAATGR